MSIVQAIVLGLVQGLTEFLPISSSAHLTLVPFVFGWSEPALAFVVAVHLGTLGAVAYIFREEVRTMIDTALHWSTTSDENRRSFRLIAIATVPAAIIGITFESAIGGAFEKPVLVSLLLGVTGYFLLSTESVTEFAESSARGEDQITPKDATVIGVAQAISILPGISRSGATIGAGMRFGLSRAAATRFSFLLSIPIIAGAVLVEIPDMFHASSSGAVAFVVGIVTSAASGFFAVRWFLGIVSRRGLRPFGVYCLVAMVVGLITALARG